MIFANVLISPSVGVHISGMLCTGLDVWESQQLIRSVRGREREVQE